MKLRPNIIKRLLASSFDSYVILLLYIALMFTIPKISKEHAEVIGYLLIILLYAIYEVSLVSYSRTVGQRMFGFKCVNFKNGEKLTLSKSIIRFVTKIPLGTFSFITILFGNERRGIHDYLSNSIIINNDETHPD